MAQWTGGIGCVLRRQEKRQCPKSKHCGINHQLLTILGSDVQTYLQVWGLTPGGHRPHFQHSVCPNWRLVIKQSYWITSCFCERRVVTSKVTMPRASWVFDESQHLIEDRLVSDSLTMLFTTLHVQEQGDLYWDKTFYQKLHNFLSDGSPCR